MRRRSRTDRIVVHCSATPEGRDIGRTDIERWHVKDNGWRHIGYHYIVRLDGKIEIGIPEEMIGIHARGVNSTSIGIVYVGGVDARMQPKDTRTLAQKTALRALIQGLRNRLGPLPVVGHRDVPGTRKACPSFDAKAEYN
jgi:N-acetylmuramoyl-L-alanine amidase